MSTNTARSATSNVGKSWFCGITTHGLGGTQLRCNVIRERKQKRINYNNQKENAKRIHHTYQVNDKILVRDKAPGEVDNKYGTPEWEGPYTVVRHNKDTGTVYARLGAITQPFNIRKIKPYHT